MTLSGTAVSSPGHALFAKLVRPCLPDPQSLLLPGWRRVRRVCLLRISCLPWIRSQRNRFRALGLQRYAHALQNGRAKSIIRIDHSNLPISELVPEPFNLFSRLSRIRSPHIDYPMSQWRVQGLSSSEQPDHWNLCFLCHRQIFHCRRRAHKKSQCKNILALQPFEARLRFCGIIAVVERHQLQLSPGDSSFIVDQFEIRLRALDLLRAKRMRGTLERGARSDHNHLVRDARRTLSHTQTVSNG